MWINLILVLLLYCYSKQILAIDQYWYCFHLLLSLSIANKYIFWHQFLISNRLRSPTYIKKTININKWSLNDFRIIKKLWAWKHKLCKISCILMSSLTSGFGKGSHWTDHLMRFKYFSNDLSFSIVASVSSQISGCIQWNSLLMPWVVSEQEQRLWLSNGGREIPFIIISIIQNLNPGPNSAHNHLRTCF